jgi:hypothetical protein
MSFSEHIIETVFTPRLRDARILVVYDEHDRYQVLCAALESDQCRVIFAGKRPVSSRQDAMERWLEMCADTTFQSRMLIHSPEAPPRDNEERQAHPFASYATLGASFPSRASDDFKQLCYGFLKERTVEVDQLFAGETEPSFAALDNLAGGSHSHPRLQEAFGTADASLILPRFLAPDTSLRDSLESNTDWCLELRQLAERTLGVKLDPRTTSQEKLRDKLWQYLLFSEFAADLPGGLPGSLADIPRAAGPHLSFCRDLCGDLRKHTDRKEFYREKAQEIESQLDLPNECADIGDLGNTDTFAFEEKSFLRRAVTAVRAGELDAAVSILAAHKFSLWTEEGERKLLWRILQLGLDTLDHIRRAEAQTQLLGHEGKELAALFDAELVKVDRYYRQLEEATAQTVDAYEEIADVVEAARKAYRAHFNALQGRFIETVQREGWPLAGLPSSADTFNDLVAPALKEGKRVVYFLVDALRLDLAQDLESAVVGHKVERLPACAQLPCVTRFGMAALLPDARNKLRMIMENGVMNPAYDGKPVDQRKDRLGIFESQFNDRVICFNLADFIEKTKTKKSRETLLKATENRDLLVLTSTELDDLGEGRTTSQLQLIPTESRRLQLAITRCAEFQYDLAVIATDHGFIWIEDTDAGTVCDKPAGEWKLKKRRCLIGQGDEGPGVIRFSTKALGIPTEEPSLVVPRALATFSQGTGYFHEGLSLQESLTPRLVVQFAKKVGANKPAASPEIGLSRKKKTVQTRIVAINVSWPGTPDMFSEGSKFKLVVLQNKKEVGQPTSTDSIEPASGLVRISQGESLKINIRLNDEIAEGPVQVKAIDPVTDKTLDSLELNFQPTVF